MIIIVLKNCVECGKEFNARGKDITCGEKCSKKHHKRLVDAYNPEYYKKNWTKWQEYRKNTEKDKNGNSDLGEKMHRNEDGSTDFNGELKLIKKEMVRLRLRYPK